MGDIQYPTTSWQITQQESFYINLGSNQPVQNVYFWVHSGNATVSVYSGDPGNWSYLGQFALQPRGTDYSVYQTFLANVNTQYLEFNVTAMNYDSLPMFSNWGITNPSDQPATPIIQVAEIGVENQNYQQIPITGITGVNTTDPTLTNLVDEQNKLEIPPTYMSKMYFDEVYFARSAENYVNHQIPNERTHPPLGKLIEASGVALFGVTPFGWRIMGVLFATLTVPLMYLLGKKLFGTWIGGFSAAFLFSFDFMHFTMARIGTVDTYVVFFSLVSQLFFLVYFMNLVKDGFKKTPLWPLFLAVVFFALGFSTKWFTLYGAAGLLALLVAVRIKDVSRLKKGLGDKYLAFFERPALLLVGFIGIAVVIYFATYLADMLAGDSFLTILKLQGAMLSFHSGTVVDPSSAPWWSWPFMFRLDGVNVPRWFDVSYGLPNNTISTITVFGNPLVWWIGFALMLVLTERAIHGRQLVANLRNRISKSATKISIRAQGWDIPAIYITVVFFFSWLPYVFIGRATYIYHFYLSVPLLCLAITYFINKYWHMREGKIAAIIIFAGTVALFVLFYPVISGAPVSSSFIHTYLKWFPSWGDFA